MNTNHKNFEEFTKAVQEGLKMYLPDDYKDAEMELVPQKKLNETYRSLKIWKPGTLIAPAINMDAAYLDYLDDPKASIGNLVEEMTSKILAETPTVDISSISVYDNAKNNLFIRVSAAEKNADYLATVPHMIQADLAITYHISLDTGRQAEGVASTTITNKMLESYGIAKEQLHEDAVKSSQNLFPAYVDSIEHTMELMFNPGGDEQEFNAVKENGEIELPNMNNGYIPLVVVSNTAKVNGAAALFYPELMDKLGAGLNGNFYILPSSIHEMLVLPEMEAPSYEDMKSMVTEVNANEVSEKEQLTDDVYHYDLDAKVFERVPDYEARIAAKEKAAEKEKAKDMEKGAMDSIHKAKSKAKSQEVSL